MSHALTEHPLPGIDSRRLQQLGAAGLASLEDLVAAGPERLAALTGFDDKTCRALVRVAEAAMTRQDPDVLEMALVRDEPASLRLFRGLSAARQVEQAVSLVRKARAHTGRRPPRASWSEAHAKTRRQLRKLLDSLQGVQQVLLSDGLSEASLEHLGAEVAALESSLAPLLEEPVRKRSLKRMRQTARRTRRNLH